MMDYWQSGTTAAETEGGATGSAQPATANGDANMDDEILVSSPWPLAKMIY